MDLKVDELLASIRKTVDDDIDALSTSMTSQSRGTLMRGALREMRINMGVEQPEENAVPAPRPQSATEDLPTLRDRIRRKVETEEILATARPVPPSPAQFAQAQRPEPVRPVRNDFSSIMALPEPQAHRGFREEAPLRPSYGADTDDLRYQPQSWQQQASQAPSYEDNAYADPRYAEPRYETPQARGLMAPHVEAATEHAFRQLSETILQRALGDRSIEDMARDMLRREIKQWIDVNLPSLVEAIVREEIERVSRRGR